MSTTEHPRDEVPGAVAAVAIRRLVNDEIADVGSRLTGSKTELFEFVCECGDLTCNGRVDLTLAAYRDSAPGSVVSH